MTSELSIRFHNDREMFMKGIDCSCSKEEEG
jgi:hypothetical protein